MIKADKGYVLFDTQKVEFISVDVSFDGYPYHTDAIWGAKIFRDKIEADRYSKLFKEGENWSILAVGIVEDTAGLDLSTQLANKIGPYNKNNS